MARNKAAAPTQPHTACAFDSVEHRRKLMQSHPMLEKSYRLNTPMIDRVYDLVFQWLILRKSGLAFKGLQRTGKTYACLRIRERLAIELPELPIVLMSGERDPKVTKERFCRRTLEASGFNVTDVPSRSSFATLLKNYLVSQCMNHGGRAALLVIDEAQMMSVTQFRYLFEMLNSMLLENFHLVTLIFGQPNLDDLLALSEEREHQEILGRFFVQVHPFGGVRSALELRLILAQYDAALHHPGNAIDWSYARYFAGDAFDAGWRLESEADRFWSALVDLAKLPDASEISGSGFRMPWVTDAIHYALTDCLISGNPPPFSSAQWGDAVRFVMRPDMLL